MTGADQTRPARVLVVDDDAQVRQVIQWALEDEGFSVSATGDGHQALRLVRDGLPDLIILDLTLPEMSGGEIVRTLRSAVSPQTPVLLITADGQAEFKAQRVGAYAYLRKPFQVQALLDAVRAGLAQP